MTVTGQLDFDLIEPVMTVPGFDINNAELVTEKFFIIVRIQDFNPNQRFDKVLRQKRIQK